MFHNAERSVDVDELNERLPHTLGACDASTLAERFGTPLLVIDEQVLRDNIRRFRNAFSRPAWTMSVTYAAKALLLKAIARIVHAEGLAIDVCSAGELETVVRAGVPAGRCLLHGCYKTPGELDLAVGHGVGHVVLDHYLEIEALAQRAARSQRPCDVFLRLNPAVAAKTLEPVRTGAADSKFGFPIDDGQAMDAVRAVQRHASLRLTGIHCHLGSQICDRASYEIAIEKLIDFAEEAYTRCAARFDSIDVGGGLGVDERGSPSLLTPEAWADAIFEVFERRFAASALSRPCIVVEPGRALIAEAGTTLYRIGVRKRLADGTDALIVDGGMSDNPRPALYEALYHATVASRSDAPLSGRFGVFGRHCETDRLFKDITLPHAEPGDILAVFGTGAYTYSMAGNYNRFQRPAVVLVKDGAARVIARRESLDDVLHLDVMDDDRTTIERG